MERKYLFEAGLNVFTSFKTIIPVEHLSELSEFDHHQYHIYGILAYDQLFYDRSKTKITSEGIKVTLVSANEQEFSLPIITLADGLDYDKVEVSVSMPYTILKVTIHDEAFLEKNPDLVKELCIYSQDLFQMYSACIIDKEEYEVLYIGQSFGTNGNRTAFDRLSSHSTLQKILTDYRGQNPDKHIYIMLLEFTTRLNMSFDGITKQYTKTSAESDKHLEDVCCNLPKENQVINITEAAMINYFKPQYNVNFVENFPNENHKGYKQYFDLDYNALTVEIDLEFDNAPQIQLYTEYSRINSSYDYIRYKLYNENNRSSMYDLFEK